MKRDLSSKSLRSRFAVGVVGLLVCGAGAAAQPTDYLPDIIIRPAELYDNQITNSGGQRLLRLSNGTANIGRGKLHLFGKLPANGDGTQDVIQRVYRSDGTSWDRVAGRFVYHPTHGHIHFEDWCIYRLRAVLPGDGVGPIVREGAKTSFCILDLQVYDSSLPGYPSGGEFNTCGTSVQGLSVGWMDVYSKSLDGQWIDITGVADGVYWLESEADPLLHVLEANESNNITRVKVVIGSGSGLAPDAYEPNNSLADVLARPVGLINSPNLGPCNPQRIVDGLSVHAANNDDYYRFYMAATGGTGDQVRIDFLNANGNLNLRLLDANGTVLATSSSTTSSSETVSLNGRPKGWYYAQAYGNNGATNRSYTMTVNVPTTSAAPAITVVSPPSGNIQLKHGYDTYRVEWTSMDPDNDPTWVTVFMNTVPALNGSEIEIPTSLNSDGSLGFHVVNSAYVPPGTYWVYASITDGSQTRGDWSAGTVTFVETHCVADFDGDTVVDDQDFFTFMNAFNNGTQSADVNEDNVIDDFDFFDFINAFFQGC
ncbi:MAG: pre-peptidase C-terminal domain-containing protein [Phycisphaerae bacterium]|nr:pre-peptidase C-terminal domain-containing protein [Phycisphaerae bacterium]